METNALAGAAAGGAGVSPANPLQGGFAVPEAAECPPQAGAFKLDRTE